MNLFEIHKATLANFENIISDIEELPGKSNIQIKFKITFTDNSSLRVSEIFYSGRLTDYSYYFLDSKNQLTIGWDTAPHHKQLKNFPYHRHISDKRKLEPSPKMDLKKVLNFIEKRIKSSS